MFWSMSESIVDSPVYVDGCNHDRKEYAGTIDVVEKIEDQFLTTTLDIYVHNEGRNVCIRYGNEGSQYMGLSLTLMAGIIGTQNECPQITSALRFLAGKGMFRCVLPQQSGGASVQERSLIVCHRTFSKLSAMCKQPDAENGRDETVWFDTVWFDDGIRMTIEVIASNEPHEESCWTQGVLFDEHGNELDCTPVGDSFGGAYVCGHNGVTYRVNVKSGPESVEPGYWVVEDRHGDRSVLYVDDNQMAYPNTRDYDRGYEVATCNHKFIKQLCNRADLYLMQP